MNDEDLSPTVQDDSTDVGRLNQLLDEITEKRYVSPAIFAQAVRGALNIYGILLPHLPVEGQDGDTPEEGRSILHAQPPVHLTPDEGEYVFAEANTGLLLYIVIDKCDDGLYECYAQLVTDDELDDLADADDDEPLDDEIPDDHPEPVTYDD